jgi:hypothetical protein
MGNNIIIYPNGPFHGLNIILRSDRVEVRHGPQRIPGKIRKFVDLDGDFGEIHDHLLAAIQPLPCPGKYDHIYTLNGQNLRFLKGLEVEGQE